MSKSTAKVGFFPKNLPTQCAALQTHRMDVTFSQVSVATSYQHSCCQVNSDCADQTNDSKQERCTVTLMLPWHRFPQGSNTPLVRLRPIGIDMAASLQEIMAEPLVGTQTGMTYPIDPDWGRSYVDWRIKQWAQRQMFTYAVCCQEFVVGCVSLAVHGRVQGVGEVGIWMAPAYWGLGHSHNATEQLIRWSAAVLGIRHVYAICLVSNLRSRSFFRKLQFEELQGRSSLAAK